MTKLLGIRTVYDIDPEKTFRVADILEVGAIMPHSVNIADLQLSELEETCSCYEYQGDNPECPVHGALYFLGVNEADGSDNSVSTQIREYLDS